MVLSYELVVAITLAPVFLVNALAARARAISLFLDLEYFYFVFGRFGAGSILELFERHTGFVYNAVCRGPCQHSILKVLNVEAGRLGAAFHTFTNKVDFGRLRPDPDGSAGIVSLL